MEMNLNRAGMEVTSYVNFKLAKTLSYHKNLSKLLFTSVEKENLGEILI